MKKNLQQTKFKTWNIGFFPNGFILLSATANKVDNKITVYSITFCNITLSIINGLDS